METLARRYRHQQHIERAELAPRFRELRPLLEEAAGIRPPSQNRESLISSARGCFEDRSHRSADTIVALKEAAAAGKLTCTVDEVIVSLLHMACVRLLRGQVRRQELVLYDSFERLLSTNLARAAQKKRSDPQ